MHAITFRAVENLAFESVADPELVEPTDALVDVTLAGLCGSDLHPYFGRERGLDPGTVMGHELVGRVAEVGSDVTGVSAGDRVVAPFTTSCGACFFCERGLTARCTRGQLFGWVEGGAGLHGAQAERVRVPLADGTLVRVPEELEDDAVALLAGDVLSTARYGAELAAVEDGDVVAMVGCGPVGLLAVRAALERGAAHVFALDRVPSRLELAAGFGAEPVDVTLDDPGEVVRAASSGRGADAAIEAVGTPEATRTAADVVRFGGRIAALGVHVETHLAISPGEIYDKNLRYAGGRCPARAFMPGSLDLARRDEATLARLVSHRLPLSEGVDAYRRFAAREEGWMKVVLRP